MRKLFAALLLALAAAAALTLGPATSPASAQTTVSISLFHRELAPHGRWFQHPRWGWAWFPIGVDAEWRPYSRGHWTWTDEHGWYWVSDEPFGWAVYHYGRWTYGEQYGWIWVPGATWGPAWVAYRYSDGHIGWAPLPPETLDAFYDGWDPAYVELSADHYIPRWIFIPRRHFLDRGAYRHAFGRGRNAEFLRASANATRFERGRRGVFNRSIDRRRLERALGRRIAAARINAVDNPRRVGPDRRGLSVNVFRPGVRLSRDVAPPTGMRARPQDRPRFAIQRNAVAPMERRARRNDNAAPGDPGTRPRGPNQAPAQPNLRRGEERRAAPGQPPGVQPPPTRPGLAQPQPRRAPPPGVTEQQRRAAPPGARPRRFTQPDAPPTNYARPPRPPHLAPGAGPQRPAARPAPAPRAQPQAPRSQPPTQRPQPQQKSAPQKSAPPTKEEEKKGR